VTRAIRRASAPLLALAIAAGAPGCGLFKPTEPEPPSGGVVQADYSDPNATLTTLRLAVEDKGRTTGQTAYLDGLASPGRDGGLNFTAIHLPSVVQTLRNAEVIIPEPWTHALESDFYRKLIAIDNSPYAMQWAVDGRFEAEDLEGADEWVLNKTYLIQSESRTIAKGYAKLTFRRTAPNRWVIVTWEERDVEAGDSEDVTFSMLRLKP
jgi:hypothetical protein